MRVIRRVGLWISLGIFSGMAGAQPARDAELPSAESVRQWLASFDRAFESRDVARLAPFYTEDVTVFEGTVTNTGWADYRDNHIGKELAEMSAASLTHEDAAVHFLGPERRQAYVASHFSLSMRIKGDEIRLQGLETLVLRRDDSGGWKIAHSHTSAKRVGKPA